MSNQTFYFLLGLGLVLIIGVVTFMKKATAAKHENEKLSKQLSVAKNQNIALQSQLDMYQRRLQ